MLKLTCESCGKVHALNSINDFSACDCGSKLLPSITSLIDSAENRVMEINTEIDKRHAEGLCGKFKVEF